MGLSDRQWYAIQDFKSTVEKTSLSKAAVQRGTDNKFWLSERRGR